MAHDPHLFEHQPPVRDGRVTVTKKQNLDSSVESAAFSGKIINAFYNELVDLPEDTRRELTSQFASEMMVAVRSGVALATGKK